MTGKPIVYNLGSDTVVLTQQPMEYEYPVTADRPKPFGKLFKSLYKVEMNGVHRGWLVSANGFSSRTALHRLSARKIAYYATGQHHSTVAAYLEDGENHRDILAKRVPELVRAGKLGTLEEQAAQATLEATRREHERVETERKMAEARRRQRQQAEEKRAMLQDRIDTLTALIGRQVLTNYETEVITAMVAELEAARDAVSARLETDAS